MKININTNTIHHNDKYVDKAYRYISWKSKPAIKRKTATLSTYNYNSSTFVATVNTNNHDLLYFDGVSGHDSMYDSCLCF